MSSQLASEFQAPIRRTRTARAISALGPATALAGLVWTLVQPDRITLLHPTEHGFWSLAIQPPLLVILVGVLFHVLVAPGLLADLSEAEER